MTIQSGPEIVAYWNADTYQTRNDSSDFMFSITQSNEWEDCIVEKVVWQIPLNRIADQWRIFKPARNVKDRFPETILAISTKKSVYFS